MINIREFQEMIWPAFMHYKYCHKTWADDFGKNQFDFREMVAAEERLAFILAAVLDERNKKGEVK